jgi:hypothetical protein
MRFAHLADLHLGGWRESKLQQLNLDAFKKAIMICKERKVDFVLIAGDLFDSPVPSLDILKEAVSGLKELRDSGIDCYIIPGSHDYSVSGKTFIEVIEKADLCRNIAKFRESPDGITLEFCIGDKILVAGLPGKKSNLEQRMFKKLIVNENLEAYKDRIKIFMLHTTLTENKPKELIFVESLDAAKLPEGFDYYAAGHIHNIAKIDKYGKVIIYPGPLFPNDFAELEKLKEGNFFIIEVEEKTKQLRIEPQKIKFKDVISINVDVNNLTPEQATKKVLDELSKHNLKDKIVLLRLYGCIEGKLSRIDFDSIEEKTNTCYVLLKNTRELTSSELKIEVKTKGTDVEDIEREIIERYKNEAELGQKKFSNHVENLIIALDTEKQEGETNTTFENRLSEEVIKILGIKNRL